MVTRTGWPGPTRRNTSTLPWKVTPASRFAWGENARAVNTATAALQGGDAGRMGRARHVPQSDLVGAERAGEDVAVWGEHEVSVAEVEVAGVAGLDRGGEGAQ